MEKITKKRNFMKADFTELSKIKTDQQKGLPQPPLEKEVETEKKLINLIPIEKITIPNNDLIKCISNRKSIRQFKDEAITLEELSFLLWASQGVREVIVRNDHAYATLRNVPSGGARHAFETYLVINNVEGLEMGIYRYIATKHKLLLIKKSDKLREKISTAALDQKFCGDSGVVFIWSAIAYRCEWRYSISSAKIMLVDSGHVCQNLYLGCEALGLGTCAIGAYNQQLVDEIIGVDGDEEFTIYLSPVGRY